MSGVKGKSGGKRRNSGRKRMSVDKKLLTRAHVKLTHSDLDRLHRDARKRGLKPPAYLRALWKLDKKGKVEWGE